MKHLGWILDLYHKPGQMVIWLKKPDGSTARIVDNWKPKIHAGGEYRDLVELACKFSTDNSRFINKYEKAGDPEKSRILEIDVESDSEAARLAGRIQREGKYSQYRLYDVDIPAPQVYLYQKDLFPLAFVEAEENHGHVQWTMEDSRNTIDFKLPPLRKIRLQLRTEKKGKVQTFQDELSSVQIAPEDEEIVCIDSGSETEKILDLVETFQKIDPDIVLTAGGDSFLFPYLARRALENGILDKLVLGREQSPLRVYEIQGHSYFSYGKILYRETAARLLGRLHIDDHNAFISVDCGLEGLYEISRTCVIPLQKACRATIGTNMSSLQLYHATKQEVLIPWNKSQPEEWKDGIELVIADRGGFIYEPETGIHDHVGELDFSSLYPMLMMKKNLSGETVKCKCCPDSPNRVPELDYNICERPGIVPLSLKILLDRRAEYKERKKQSLDHFTKQKYDERQSALKWILVCCLPYDSPVLISQNGRTSYQQIGRVIDRQLGDDAGVFDCSEELFVAGVDKDMKSKFCRVSKLIKTVSPRKLLQVKMEDGRQVNCTSNHSFYVLRNGSLVEVTAEKLSTGDLIPTAKRVAQNNTAISNLDLLTHVRQQIDIAESDLWRAKSDNLRSLVNSSANVLEVILKREGRHVQNLGSWRRRGIIPFRYLNLLPNTMNQGVQIGRGRIGGGHVAWLPASLEIDEDLGFFLGFYVANGSAGENFIRLDVGGDEREIIDHLCEIIETKFGLIPRVYKEPRANMFIVQINSVSLVQVLNRIFELPSSSNTGKLKVPPLLFNAPPEAILGFISGLVAGDGSVNKARDHVSISTCSYDFAVEIGYLALCLGIPYNIIRGKRLHRIYFSGPNGLHSFKKLFLKKKHRTRFETIKSRCVTDCRHAIFEMFPVEQSGLKEIAVLARTARAPRLEGRLRVCPERAKESLYRISKKPRFPTLREAHLRIEKLLDSDIGFVAVKTVSEIESTSPYVYCFEISENDETFPGFFTGNGSVLVHNSFGYLGFKNARFGKIDAHIATCAFSRVVIKKAIAMAEEQGFRMVHAIVDSMWLKKPGATTSDYEKLAGLISKEFGLPLGFEGEYKWIVFLNSKINPRIPVLNRYYGVYQDGTIKIRGIDLRRHDTPEIVRKCQSSMLEVFSGAENSEEFIQLIPTALRVLKGYVSKIRDGKVRLEELVITKSLSKNPGEYSHHVPQAVAARLLVGEGGTVHAGQQVDYILTQDRFGVSENRAVPWELADEDTVYDPDEYVKLLLSSAANLLLPFGYDTKTLARTI